MSDNQSITRDPIYYITVCFFALLTTLLPAALGQRNFLPILQTIFLTIYIAVPLHHRNFGGALRIIALWLPIQFVVILLLTFLFPNHLQTSIPDGFAFRGAISAWYSAIAPFPNGLISNPIGYVIEFAAILLGSLATAGLVGIWFLVRLVNQAAFGTGILLGYISNPMEALLVIPYWTLLRTVGYAGLVVLCANPLLTYNWSPTYYWQNHRKLILVSVALLLLGLALELFLPGIVTRRPVP